MLSVYVIAFFVSDEIFGYVTLLQAGFITASTFFGFNLQAAFVRYYYESTPGTILHSLKPVYLALGIGCIMASLIILGLTYSHAYYRWFSLLPLCGYFSGLVVVSSIVARCNNDLYGYAVAEISRPLFIALAVALFWLFGQIHNIVSFYILAVILSCLTVLFFSRLHFRKHIAKSLIKEIPTKKLILYVFPLFLVQIVSLVNNVGDRYILKLYLPVEAVGQYGKAYLVGSAVGMLFDSLALLWFPYIVKNKDIFFRDIYRRTKFIVLTAFSASFIFLIIAGYVYKNQMLLLGFETQLVVIGLVVLAAFLARVGYQVYVPILSAYDKTAIVAKISMIGAIIGLALNFVLIPSIGGYGSAIATWLSFFIFSVTSFWTVEKLATQVAVKDFTRAV